MDLANLGLTVDSRKVARAESDLSRFSRTSARANDNARKLSGSSRTLEANMARTARSIAGLVAATASLNGIIRIANDFDAMTNRLVAMGSSTDEAASQIKALGEIASQTRTPLDSVAQLFTRVSIASGELSASQKDVLDFTEAVGLALGASGVGAQEASGSLLQLSQALAGGTVRAEEFNSILEGAFPIAQAAARGLEEAGGSVGKLRQLVVEGEVSSREFFDAILSQQEALAEVFGKTTPTIAQAMTELRNSLGLTIGSFNRSVGASNALAQGILIVANNIERIAVIAATGATIFGGKLVASFVAARIATFSLTGALAGLRVALIRTGIGALIIGAGELVYQFTRLMKSTGGFGEAMQLLGEVASGVWQGISGSAKAIIPAINAVWSDIQAGFRRMIAELQAAWSQFLHAIADGVAETPGFSQISGKLSDLGSAAADAAIKSNVLANSLSGDADSLRNRAQELSSAGFDKAAEALGKLKTTVTSANGEIATTASTASTAVSELNDLSDAATGAAGGLSDAQKEAIRLREEMEGPVISSIDGVSSAFGDFVANGLRDFDDFTSSVLRQFQGMLSQMIATAVANPIKIGLGLGGTTANPIGLLQGTGAGNLLGGFGSGLSGLFSGGTGILGGIGASFGSLGKLFTGGFSALGGVGSALGAIAPALGVVGVAISGLIGKTKELDRGLQVSVAGSGTRVQSFQRIERSRLFGLSKSRRTRIRGVSNEVSAPIVQAIDEIQSGLIGSAQTLGITANAFDGFTHRFRVSLKGLSKEAQDAAIQGALENLANSFANFAVPPWFIREGEGAAAALERLSSSLVTVNDVLRSMGLNQFQTGLGGADGASRLAEFFGGLDQFTAATSQYMASFYTESERLEDASDRLQEALNSLGVNVVPATRSAFRDLVDRAINSRNLERAAGLIQLAPLFDSVKASADSLADAARVFTEVSENEFATGFDFRRAQSRLANGTFTGAPRVRDAIGSQGEDFTAELRGIRREIEIMRSSSEITAANTGRAADLAEDQLAEQELANL